MIKNQFFKLEFYLFISGHSGHEQKICGHAASQSHSGGLFSGGQSGQGQCTTAAVIFAFRGQLQSHNEGHSGQ